MSESVVARRFLVAWPLAIVIEIPAGTLAKDKLVAVLSDSPMADIADIAELDTSFAGVNTILVTWLENYKGPGMVEVEGIEKRRRGACGKTPSARTGARDPADTTTERRDHMNLYVGTSGFSYKGWKGPFYPEKLADREMLAYYGSQLPAVEINNTFYRMPKVEVFEGWAEKVPEGFRFSIKASRRITHFKRLKDAEEILDYLLAGASALGARLGVLLFQLPPNFRADLERLKGFVGTLPKDVRCAFEFRHDSWRDDAVHEVLRDHGVALVTADTDDEDADIVSTAPWGYVRLRKTDYTDEQTAAWAERVTGQEWGEAFVFFKHEDAGVGPLMARKFLQSAASS